MDPQEYSTLCLVWHSVNPAHVQFLEVIKLMPVCRSVLS